MLSFLRAVFQLNRIWGELNTIRMEVDDLKLLIGSKYGTSINREIEIGPISNAEYKVYSQWGDDGIIQHLITLLNIDNRIFVEFGVGDYRESTTRFLLENNNWSGVVLDSSRENIQKIRRSDRYWKHDLRALHLWVTRDNINDEISKTGLSGEIGLLHIDIDGNDYWIWQAIEVITPILAIIEYNSVFGVSREITVPYQDDFDRTERHYSNLYFGASLSALCYLAKTKGYCFIGCNSAGNNAYFIKSSHMNRRLIELTPEEGYVYSKFRESRNNVGQLSFAREEERLAIIKGLPVLNVRENRLEEL